MEKDRGSSGAMGRGEKVEGRGEVLGIKCNVSQTTLLCGEKGVVGKEVVNGAAAALL